MSHPQVQARESSTRDTQGRASGGAACTRRVRTAIASTRSLCLVTRTSNEYIFMFLNVTQLNEYLFTFFYKLPRCLTRSTMKKVNLLKQSIFSTGSFFFVYSNHQSVSRRDNCDLIADWKRISQKQ